MLSIDRRAIDEVFPTPPRTICSEPFDGHFEPFVDSDFRFPIGVLYQFAIITMEPIDILSPQSCRIGYNLERIDPHDLSEFSGEPLDRKAHVGPDVDDISVGNVRGKH